MLTIEQSVKRQFAKVFAQHDWRLFKEIAEINLAEAALLKKSSLQVPDNRKLLFRNIRKRLLIGIGVELLLKAVYLKAGHGINKPRNRETGPKLLYKLSNVAHDQLDANETFSLNQLIDSLKHVHDLFNPAATLDGLKVAKVYRNKEGHVVTRSHKYDPSSYRAIEDSLVDVYKFAFEEKLEVKFSLKKAEKGLWRVTL